MLIDDVPHYSCSVLTHTVRTKAITTVEGLAAADGTLHPVQQAVVDNQAFQCAFCIPGFVMATTGYLKVNPNPTRVELARRRFTAHWQPRSGMTCCDARRLNRT